MRKGATLPRWPVTHRLALNGSDRELRAALAGGEPTDEPFGPDELTPLHLAVDSGNLSAAAMLLAAGADPTARCRPGGAVALHLAAYRGHTEIAEVILAFGSLAGVVDEDGRSALHYAAEGGYGTLTVTELLIGRGVKVNGLTRDLDSPLMLASLRCDLAVARALLQAGAVSSLVNASGQTAFDVAVLQMAALPRTGSGSHRRIHPDYQAKAGTIRDYLRLLRRATGGGP